MQPIDNLLSRLDRVKLTGNQRWLARCPAHGDKNPSLSLRETTDGRILLHCFSGCIPSEILYSVGLKLGDLFNDNQIGLWQASGPFREAIEWSYAVNLIANYDQRQGVSHSDGDLQTIAKAVDILGEIPMPPKPQGKPKLAPFAKQLADRQRYNNRPFLVIVCIGINAWDRAKNWSESKNDIVGLVLPDCWPEFYIWPVDGCTVIIERDLAPGDEVIVNLVKCLLSAGAWRVIVQPVSGEFERIYCGLKEVRNAA